MSLIAISRTGRVGGWLVLWLWVSLAGAQPVLTNAPGTLAELRQQLSNLVAEPRFAAGTFAIKIVSLETGQTLFENDAHKLVSPASNAKLYTLALALDKLGGDYRIRTSLYAARKPDAQGKLTGDLIVFGRGDPGFNARRFDGDIFRALQPLVAALTNAGVREISGDLIGDESYFIGPRYGSGWAWDDMIYYYGAELSALTINDNTLRVTVKPGPAVLAPPELTVQPNTSYVVLTNRARTAPTNAPRTLNFYRPLEQNLVHVSGHVPVGAATSVETITVHNPAGMFVAFFREALQRNGVKVAGTTRSVSWLERQWQPLNFAELVELGAVESQTMRELNKEVQKPSQNLYTDLILAHVGAVERERALARRDSSVLINREENVVGTATAEELGIRELDKFLNKLPIRRGEVRFEEGSGLSRNNLVTANATVALLRFMHRHTEAASYRDALPIAGVDGTLRNRMKGTKAEGNMRAKTGTLRWANGLSGYVTTAAGEQLAFSLILNRYASATAENSARAELDRVAVWLAEFTGRSQ